MYHLKIRRIGNSLGVILPQTFLAELATGEGDTLVLSGGRQAFVLRPVSVRNERALAAFEEGRGRYHNLMRQLASED